MSAGYMFHSYSAFLHIFRSIHFVWVILMSVFNIFFCAWSTFLISLIILLLILPYRSDLVWFQPHTIVSPLNIFCCFFYQDIILFYIYIISTASQAYIFYLYFYGGLVYFWWPWSLFSWYLNHFVLWLIAFMIISLQIHFNNLHLFLASFSINSKTAIYLRQIKHPYVISFIFRDTYHITL